jgi:hypothetical protein
MRVSIVLAYREAPLGAAHNDRFERFTKQAAGFAGGSVTSEI